MILQSKKRKWILIVEDDQEIRSLLREMIEDRFQEGVSVIEASDGVEASTKISLQAFDCILTDVEMPRKDGGSLIKQIRSNSFNSLTPIIIVSGSDQKVSIQEDHHFVYLIAKPFDRDDLLDLVENQLKIGGNDNRVSVDILNDLVTFVTEFIKEVSGQELEQEGELVAKPAGADFGVMLASTIKVKIGDVVNTFSILVSESDLSNLSKSSKSLAEKSPQHILNSMSFVVLKHVMDRTGLIKREQFNANLISNGPETIRNKTGVLLSLGADNLQIKIFASTK